MNVQQGGQSSIARERWYGITLLSLAASTGQLMASVPICEDGTFAPHVLYRAGISPNFVVMAHLNDDGHLDLAVANIYGGVVSILLNNSDGTFAPFEAYETGDFPWAVAAGDLDGDGDEDLAVANSFDNNDQLSILMNHGDGTFAPQILYTLEGYAVSVAVGDVDNDLDLDLVIAMPEENKIAVMINNSTGAFTYSSFVAGGPGCTPPCDQYSNDPVFVALGYLDGDAYLDVVCALSFYDHVSVLMNDGSGGFPNRAYYEAGNRPQSVAVGDLDGDLDQDLVVSTGSDGAAVLLNDGAGLFTHGGLYGYQDTQNPWYSWSVALGDYDGDFDLDIAMTYQVVSKITILLNDGDAVFGPDVLYPVGNTPLSVATGDLDGDGDLDLAVANQHEIDDNNPQTEHDYFISVLLNNSCEAQACPADLSGDGAVNAADLAQLLGSWGPCSNCPADLTGNGVVDAADLAQLLGDWGPCD